MSQNCAPNAALFRDFEHLARRGVHFASSVLLHTDLEGRLMDQNFASLSIIPQTVTGESISGVEHIAVLFAHENCAIRLSAMVDFNHGQFFEPQRLAHHPKHLMHDFRLALTKPSQSVDGLIASDARAQLLVVWDAVLVWD
mmetsp:Transcript_32077/g.42536  ORF Transcript_32077/g.42536 Transcript_32077/m.42536 type:complete len:141 (+) Transcript_32077:327-749(+)